MKKSTLALLIVLLPALGAGLAQARTPKAAAPPDAASAAPPAAASAPAASERSRLGRLRQRRGRRGGAHRSAEAKHDDEPSTAHRHRLRSDNDVVNIGSDSHLPQGERADSVVAIFGSSSVEGDTRDAVSILGNTRVTGSVHDSAVAVLGNVYVDGAVDGDVVAVMGNVELGPNAVVGHDAVAVGGTVHRDPAAIVHGNVQIVGGPIGGFDWLHPWIRHCLLYGRPLAFADGLGWAWGCALLFLGLYMGLALLFRDAVTRCVETFETRPGMAVVAALLMVLLIPVLLMLLFITVIGIAAIPFVAFGLLCVGLFGKTVMLAWIGRRCLKKGSSPALEPPGRGSAHRRPHRAGAVRRSRNRLLGLQRARTLGTRRCRLHAHRQCTRLARGAWRGRYPGRGLSRPGLSRHRSGRRRRTGRSGAGRRVHGRIRRRGCVRRCPTCRRSATRCRRGRRAHRARRRARRSVDGAGHQRPPCRARGFGSAWLALLLDALLVGFLMHLLHHMFNLELVMLAIYGAIMWKLRGSTIGGIVFDLQVVRLDGRPIDWETAIVRALGCFLSLAVAGLGFFWIAFDRGRQAWHDKIAGTAVVRVAKGVPLV